MSVRGPAEFEIIERKARVAKTLAMIKEMEGETKNKIVGTVMLSLGVSERKAREYIGAFLKTETIVEIDACLYTKQYWDSLTEQRRVQLNQAEDALVKVNRMDAYMIEK